MMSHGGLARVLSHSAQPRILPGGGSLYTRPSVSPARPRLALAPRASSRRTFVTIPSMVNSLGDALSSIHSFTGIPWYILLPALGITHSALFNLPFRFTEQRLKQRRNLLYPLGVAWTYKAARARVGNPTRLANQEMKRIRIETKTQLWRSILPSLTVTLPSWFFCVHLVRQLAVVDPSLATGGCLWFGNLAAADPTGVLPVAAGAAMVLRSAPRSKDAVERLFDPKNNSIEMRFQRGSLVAAPILAAILLQTPAGVVLFFVASVASNQLGNMFASRYRSWTLPSNTTPRWTTEPWFIDGPK